jgi:hypothetical protein
MNWLKKSYAVPLILLLLCGLGSLPWVNRHLSKYRRVTEISELAGEWKKGIWVGDTFMKRGFTCLILNPDGTGKLYPFGGREIPVVLTRTPDSFKVVDGAGNPLCNLIPERGDLGDISLFIRNHRYPARFDDTEEEEPLVKVFGAAADPFPRQLLMWSWLITGLGFFFYGNLSHRKHSITRAANCTIAGGVFGALAALSLFGSAKQVGNITGKEFDTGVVRCSAYGLIAGLVLGIIVGIVSNKRTRKDIFLPFDDISLRNRQETPWDAGRTISVEAPKKPLGKFILLAAVAGLVAGAIAGPAGFFLADYLNIRK